MTGDNEKHELREVRIYLIAAIAVMLLFWVLLTSKVIYWQQGYAILATLFTLFMAGLFTLGIRQGLRNPAVHARWQEWRRAHPRAVGGLVLGIAGLFLALLYINAGAYGLVPLTPDWLLAGLFAAMALAGISLATFLLWQAIRNPESALRQYWRRHAVLVPLLTLVVVALLGTLLVGLALFTQPLASVAGLQVFLSVLAYPSVIGVRIWHILRVPKTNRAIKALGVVATVLLWTLIIGSSTDYRCEKADCGGALYRSKEPATWAQQLAAANELAFKEDPQALLVSVLAKPTQHQPPTSAYIVMDVEFGYARPNAMGFDINLQDNAIVWKRDIDSEYASHTYPAQDTIMASRRILSTVSLSASDVWRIAGEKREAFRQTHGAVSSYTRIQLEFMPGRSRATGVGKVEAAWHYEGWGGGDANLDIWIDATNGAIIGTTVGDAATGFAAPQPGATQEQPQ